MLHAERNEAVHVIAAVTRYVGVAVFALNENELICLLDDIVFIFEQNDVTVRCDDVREFVRCSKRTRRIAVNDILRLLPSNVRVEMGKIDVHKYSPSLSSYLALLYIFCAHS